METPPDSPALEPFVPYLTGDTPFSLAELSTPEKQLQAELFMPLELMGDFDWAVESPFPPVEPSVGHTTTTSQSSPFHSILSELKARSDLRIVVQAVCKALPLTGHKTLMSLLPEATVQKIVTEILASKPGTTFAKEARDLLIDCSVEFITLISSEANEIAEKESKKTIAAEHVTKALEDLGFHDYVQDIKDEAAEHKEKQKIKEKKQTRWEKSGKTEEELLREQEELFGLSREKYNHEGPPDAA